MRPSGGSAWVRAVKRGWAWPAALIGWGLVLGAVGPDEREAAQRALEAAISAAGELRAYTCRIRTEIAVGEVSMTSDGELAYLRPAYLRLRTTIPVPDGEPLVTLTITDGALLYTETRAGVGEPPVVIRARATPPAGGEPASAALWGQTVPSELMTQLRELFEFELDASATDYRLQGQPMDVLVGRYRGGSLARFGREGTDSSEAAAVDAAAPLSNRELLESLMDRVRLSIGREDRFLHRLEMFPRPQAAPPPADAPEPPLGRKLTLPQITLTFYDIGFNAELQPADFVYVPPVEAQLIDLAGGETSPPSPDGSRP